MKLNTKALLFTAIALFGVAVLSFRADLIPTLGPHLGGDLGGGRSILDPQGAVAQAHLDSFMPILLGSAVLFIILAGMLMYTLFASQGTSVATAEADRTTPTGRRIRKAWIGIASFYFILLLTHVFQPSGTPQTTAQLDEKNPETLVINVTAHLWWYSFHYPEQGIVTSNEFVFPTHTPVKINLLSQGPIHGFWIPKLTGKATLPPGEANHVWVYTDTEGNYSGQCTEFCGESHAYMLFRGHATSRGKFDKWVHSQRQPAKLEGLTPQEQLGYDLFTGKKHYALAKEKGMDGNPINCTACHILGTQPDFPHAPYRISPFPNLTNFAERTTLAAGWRNLDRENLKEWIQQPGKVKPGNLMWKKFAEAYGIIDPNTAPSLHNRGETQAQAHSKFFTDEEANALAAFLLSLRSPGAQDWTRTPMEKRNGTAWMQSSSQTHDQAYKVAAN